MTWGNYLYPQCTLSVFRLEMLPETDFHKMRKMMFLIFNGRFYNASNSAQVEDNFLELCDLRFPVMPGRMLSEDGKNYFKRNRASLEKLKNKMEKEILKTNEASAITQSLNLEEDVQFFLNEICPIVTPHLEKRNYVPFTPPERSSSLDELPEIFPSILNGNCAGINGRIYPLRPVNGRGFVRLSGREYGMGKSEVTIDEAEARFFQTVEWKIKEQVLITSKEIKDLLTKLEEAKQKNKALAEDWKVSIYPHCYECGQFGFDKTVKILYHLINPHHNSNTSRAYEEGQSAISLPLLNKQIHGTVRFAERPNRDSPFSVSSYSTCSGGLPIGDAIGGRAHYLQVFADMIGREGKFHANVHTDSSDGY